MKTNNEQIEAFGISNDFDTKPKPTVYYKEVKIISRVTGVIDKSGDLITKNFIRYPQERWAFSEQEALEKAEALRQKAIKEYEAKIEALKNFVIELPK